MRMVAASIKGSRISVSNSKAGTRRRHACPEDMFSSSVLRRDAEAIVAKIDTIAIFDQIDQIAVIDKIVVIDEIVLPITRMIHTWPFYIKMNATVQNMLST